MKKIKIENDKRIKVTKKRINIFIFGDLVLDQAIFVKEKTRPYQPVESERVFEVKTRLNSTGGAANSARILASLSLGKTYLWGITGRSDFGKFPAILDQSCLRDAVEKYILMRGYHIEMARMNAITRIIHVKEDEGIYTHMSRFDDVGYISITEQIIDTAIADLEDAHNASALGAIILNDLDIGTLNSQIIEKIASFANRNEIPIFVDPKRDIAKYENIRATAILPNFEEWCYITGIENKETQGEWRTHLESEGGIKKITSRSLEHLSNFKYHIIKCDKDGAVIICPDDKNEHIYKAFRVIPHEPNTGPKQNHQLGCGDLLTAIFALEFASSESKQLQMNKILDAFRCANAVIASYRENPWNCMPKRRDIENLKNPPPELEEKVTFPAGVCYLPRKTMLELDDYRTDIPNLVSTDPQYKNEIKRLIKFFLDTDGNVKKHAILTGKGGSGKSEIQEHLKKLLTNKDIKVNDFSNDFGKGSEDEVIEAIIKIASSSHNRERLLLIVDEFYKNQWIKDTRNKGRGVLLLEKAKQNNVQFLLIDADFNANDESLSSSQFVSRCELFCLPEIMKRPYDIPYIFAQIIFVNAEKKGKDEIFSVACAKSFLVFFINSVLQDKNRQNVRVIVEFANEVFKKAIDNYNGGSKLNISLAHLPERLSHSVMPIENDPLIYFQK